MNRRQFLQGLTAAGLTKLYTGLPPTTLAMVLEEPERVVQYVYTNVAGKQLSGAQPPTDHQGLLMKNKEKPCDSGMCFT